MKQGVCVALAAVVLAAGAPDLPAQPARGGYVATSFSAPADPDPGVSLGRPVALRNDDASDARPVPGYTPGLLPISYPLPRNAGRARPQGAILAASATLPAWPTEADAGIVRSVFAVERPDAAAGVAPATLELPLPLSAPPAASASKTAGPDLLGAAPANAAPALPPPFSGYADAPYAEPDADPSLAPLAPFSGTFSPLQRHFWVSGEYLLWSLNGYHIPPLVTTSSPADEGILGNPTTQTLFGGNSIAGGSRSGARFMAGYWLDPCGEKAIEVGGFFLGTHTTSFNATSAQDPVLARPFFNLNSGTQFSELVAFPGIATGSVNVNAPSSLWGLQTNLVCQACCGCNYRVNWLAGFRYLSLTEGLTITENVNGTANAPAPFTNAVASAFDSFNTRNQFYGGQVGADLRYRLAGRWTLDLRGQLGLGDTHQRISINGGQTIDSPTTGVTTAVGGLLALPSNIGTFTRDRFSVVPQVGLNIGYQITPYLRAFGGYNVLFWSNVVRPGNQIDTTLDVTQIPNFNVPGAVPTGLGRPQVPFRESDLWVQGLSLGIEFNY